MERKAFSTYLVAACISGSFVLGLYFPSRLGAQGGLPERVAAARQNGGRGLDPLQSYSGVLNELKNRYYGELPADNEVTYSAIRGLLKAVDDPYTRFLDPDEYRVERERNQGEFVGIGALLEPRPTKEGYVRVSQPIKGGPAFEAGLAAGDLITKVNGKSINGQSVDQVVKIIKGPAGTPVRLTIQRPGKTEPIEMNLTRRLVEVPPVESRMEPGNIGYVRLTQFVSRADEKLEAALKDLKTQGMKGLVLDLRGNPGGFLEQAIDVVSQFIPPRNNAVVIVESGGERNAKRCNPRKYLNPEYPIIVLINQSSASASEIVAGAFQDTNSGIVVGQTTYGKGLVQTLFTLPQDNSAVMITTHKYLTSKGRDINRTREARGGVKPDVEVDYTEKDFIEKRDPQLAKALEILHEKTGYVKPAAAVAGNGAAPPPSPGRGNEPQNPRLLEEPSYDGPGRRPQAPPELQSPPGR